MREYIELQTAEIWYVAWGKYSGGIKDENNEECEGESRFWKEVDARTFAYQKRLAWDWAYIETRTIDETMFSIVKGDCDDR
jgi:hypothetical protein